MSEKYGWLTNKYTKHVSKFEKTKNRFSFSCKLRFGQNFILKNFKNFSPKIFISLIKKNFWFGRKKFFYSLQKLQMIYCIFELKKKHKIIQIRHRLIKFGTIEIFHRNQIQKLKFFGIFFGIFFAIFYKIFFVVFFVIFKKIKGIGENFHDIFQNFAIFRSSNESK